MIVGHNGQTRVGRLSDKMGLTIVCPLLDIMVRCVQGVLRNCLSDILWGKTINDHLLLFVY